MHGTSFLFHKKKKKNSVGSCFTGVLGYAFSYSLELEPLLFFSHKLQAKFQLLVAKNKILLFEDFV